MNIIYESNAYKFNIESLSIEIFNTAGNAYSIAINNTFYGSITIDSPTSIKTIYKQYLSQNPTTPVTQQTFLSSILTFSYQLKLRQYTIPSKEPSSPLPTLTSEHLDFLKQPDLLDAINDIIHHATTKPFVGEDANTLITFFSALSSLTPYGITLDVIASSAAGKTFLITTVLKLFPDSMKWEWGNVSAQVLTYAGEPADPDDPDNTDYIINIDGKTIAILEKEQSLQFIQNIKPLMSHDSPIIKLPRASATVGGTRKTSYYIIKGNASFILCSTKNVTDEEEITRTFSISPSESFEKIAKVCQSQLSNASKSSSEIIIHPKLSLVQSIIPLLPKIHPINIFVSQLDGLIPYDTVQRQRDITRIINLISSITLLHQYQRPYVIIDGKKNVLSSLEDNIIGLSLLDQILGPSLTGLSTLTLRIYDLIKEMYDKAIPLSFNRIFNYVRANRISLPKSQLHENHINRLIDRGYLTIHKTSKHIDDYVYRINPTATYLTAVSLITETFLSKVKKNLTKIIKPRIEFINNCSIDVEPNMAPSTFHRILSFTPQTPQLTSLISFNYFNKKSTSVLKSFSNPNLFNRHPLLTKSNIFQDWQVYNQQREEMRDQILTGIDIQDIDINSIIEQTNIWSEQYEKHRK